MLTMNWSYFLIFLSQLDILTSVNTIISTLNKEILSEWEAWKLQHGKIYKVDQEESFRRGIWLKNKVKIDHHNKEYSQGRKSFSVQTNKFSDQMHHEVTAKAKGHNSLRNTTLKGYMYQPDYSESLPLSVDWRTKGAVTRVKDQGHCGSCWAFAATGALEAMNFIAHGALVSLSEQNLIDCSPYDHGCKGGRADHAFYYVGKNKGIDLEKSYPYEAQNNTCRYKPDYAIIRSRVAFMDIPIWNEWALGSAIATKGPVTVGIDASHWSFAHYSGGIYRHEKCSTSTLDHAVLAVGYGVDEDSGEEFYILKNSWGAEWGEGGYMRMARTWANMCGVATQATFPILTEEINVP